eukprot:gene58130-biopygen10690
MPGMGACRAAAESCADAVAFEWSAQWSGCEVVGDGGPPMCPLVGALSGFEQSITARGHNGVGPMVGDGTTGYACYPRVYRAATWQHPGPGVISCSSTTNCLPLDPTHSCTDCGGLDAGQCCWRSLSTARSACGSWPACDGFWTDDGGHAGKYVARGTGASDRVVVDSGTWPGGRHWIKDSPTLAPSGSPSTPVSPAPPTAAPTPASCAAGAETVWAREGSCGDAVNGAAAVT